MGDGHSKLGKKEKRTSHGTFGAQTSFFASLVRGTSASLERGSVEAVWPTDTQNLAKGENAHFTRFLWRSSQFFSPRWYGELPPRWHEGTSRQFGRRTLKTWQKGKTHISRDFWRSNQFFRLAGTGSFRLAGTRKRCGSLADGHSNLGKKEKTHIWMDFWRSSQFFRLA